MGLSRQRGFTLIELVVTVAIVALLASAAMPVVELAVKRNREQELRTALRELRTAIDAYKRAYDEGRIQKNPLATGYPPTLAALVDGVPDARQPDKRKIYFLRRLPADPMQPGIKDPLDAWGRRAYASPRERPEEGADVFDVYSRSDAVGIDGRPYRDW
ncbi:MAG: type II secretion system GspH family protein [Betaproteobacteria bacterium]|nr:type II secretion system GspH family protein [Betaproteobacteria bacterium]